MVDQLTFKQVFQIALIGFAFYFPAALYLQNSYVKQPEQPRRAWLTGPFIRQEGAAYIAYVPKFEDMADSQDDPFASNLVLYENEHPIGPAHATHIDVAHLGKGHYSHWKGQGLIFSASDNSDPNINWKRYWVRIEPPHP